MYFCRNFEIVIACHNWFVKYVIASVYHRQSQIKSVVFLFSGFILRFLKILIAFIVL